MSFTRTAYDSCAYQTALNQSVAPISYQLDVSRFEACNKCRNELGLLGGTAVSHVNGNLVDLENDLRGQNRPATRCAQYKYLPPTGNVIQGKEYIKPVDHPQVDISMRHLQPCQMFQYPEVPMTPSMDLFSCPRRK